MKTCPKCGVEYPDTTTLCPADGVALETTSDSLIGTTLAGKYRIDARLNEGGMGTVYRATHVLMEKTVAIKVLRPSLAADEKIVARFSREARAASRISHPNALSVTDFGEDENGIVFLVMEFLSGKTLKQVIRDEGPLPLQKVVEITRQVGDALNAAHLQGVVHRDLKSDNIMLLDSTAGEHAKVLDFGIAKINEPGEARDAGLTAPNLVIGTPQYMSPEQCSQETEIDSRSDIYSLGVILYEMLVGHVPFTADSPTMVMMKHLQEPVPSVLEERPDLPAAIGRVIARAMAKLPANRYQTIAELVEDLTIASGLAQFAPVPAQPANVGASATAVTDEPDEVTVVRTRQEPPPPVLRRAPVTVPVQGATSGPMPPVAAAASFNPLKVIIPSVIGLLVVFVAIYAWKASSVANEPNANQPQQELAADPNSQPVQPGASPTGKSEEGIPVGGSVVPPANVSASPNVNVAVSPEPIEDVSPVANANANENSNSNSNSNSNRKTPPLPEPTRSVMPPEGVPSPAATKPPERASPVPTPTSPGGD
ncbi:MAG TPA: protein kinase [Pyrinomonadaceae bacterium]|nr:protein kinase [Pyrinomonadaceae bacterium]